MTGESPDSSCRLREEIPDIQSAENRAFFSKGKKGLRDDPIPGKAPGKMVTK